MQVCKVERDKAGRDAAELTHMVAIVMGPGRGARQVQTDSA